MAVKQVALIRGINVGKAKRVAMADLRALVEGLGYKDVRTLLNSGNVVFSNPRPSSDDAAGRMETALVKKLGVSARFTVLTASELAAIVAENPLLEVADNPSRLMVVVPRSAADLAKVKPFLKQDWAPEVLAVGSRAAYFWLPEGVLESQLFEAVARALGDGVTTRNWATIQKLHALVGN